MTEQPPPQPYGAPPPSPPPRRGLGRTAWIVIGVITGLFALALVAGTAFVAGAALNAVGTSEEPTEETPKVKPKNEPKNESRPQPQTEPSTEATSGGVKVKINSTSRTTSVSDELDTYEASGEYLIVNMTVTNVGKEPWPTADEDHDYQLITADGTTYTSDLEATIASNTNTGFSELNPGNSANIRYAFDIPEGMQVELLSFIDTMDPMAEPAEVKIP